MARQGHRNLLSFYRAHAFSFSYEYLRQIVQGNKVPSPNKVKELATALGLNLRRFQQAANEFRFEQDLKRYKSQASTTQQAEVAEKVRSYGKKGKLEVQLERLIATLTEAQQKHMVTYIKFMKQQWRKQKQRKT